MLQITQIFPNVQYKLQIKMHLLDEKSNLFDLYH